MTISMTNGTCYLPEFVFKPRYTRETIVIYSVAYLHYPRLVHILYKRISVY